MNKEKALLKNTAIVAIGQICTKFIGFFLLPLYTAILSTEEYGTVDIFNTYISLLLPIAFFQIDQATFRFLIDIRDDNNQKEKLISTVLLTVFVQSLIYLNIYIVIAQFIDNNYKYFLITNVIATIISSLMLEITRGLGDNTTYSLGSLVSGSGTIVLNVLFIAVFKSGAYGMFLAAFLANIICAIFVFFRKRIYKYISIRRYSITEIKRLWKYSLPMIPNQLSWWVINTSDRTIISYMLGVGINGIYSAANKFSAICITIFDVFNLTWTESASVNINDKESEEYFSSTFNIAMKLFTSLCFFIIVFMPFLFRFFINNISYSDAYYQIPILLIATIFNMAVSMLGSIYVALKMSKEIAKTSLIAALINIIVNLALIHFIRLYAASVSTLVAFLFMTIYRYRDVQKYRQVKVDRAFTFAAIIIGTYIIISYYLHNIIIHTLGVFLVTIFAYVYNRSTIFIIAKKSLQTIKSKLRQ